MKIFICLMLLISTASFAGAIKGSGGGGSGKPDPTYRNPASSKANVSKAQTKIRMQNRGRINSSKVLRRVRMKNMDKVNR